MFRQNKARRNFPLIAAGPNDLLLVEQGTPRCHFALFAKSIFASVQLASIRIWLRHSESVS